MSGFALFARACGVFWPPATGSGDLAMRYFDGNDQPAGTKFSYRHAHWCGDS